jgi:hypothetical protein
VFVKTGLFGGSSGGIYAISSNDASTNGKVLAMHIESVSTGNTVEYMGDDATMSDDMEAIGSASDSNANCHASFVSGIIICKYKKLYNFIIDSNSPRV